MIDLGHAHRMMADWWDGDPRDASPRDASRTWILCGANPGSEGDNADEDDNFTSIFEALFAPPTLMTGRPVRTAWRMQAVRGPRRASHDAATGCRMWATDEGRAVVQRWRSIVGTTE